MADVIEIAIIAGHFFERERSLAGSLPLFNESPALLIERDIKRLEERGGGIVEAISKGEAECELVRSAQIQLPGQGDVSIFSRVEFPIHLEIIRQISPSIARSDVAARAPEEGHCGAKRQPCPPLAGGENFSSCDLLDLPIVPPAPDLKVRSQ